MKVVFFNRFFHPDLSGTSQMLGDLAFGLARRGHEVQVVTSRVPGGEARSERVGDLMVERVADARPRSRGLGQRAADYLAFYRGAREAARRLVARGDIVVVMTDPPLLSIAVGGLADRRGAAVVHWLQDIFPEVAQAHGVPGAGGLAGALLRRARNRSMTGHTVVVISQRMAAKVETMGAVPLSRLHVIHNWADGSLVRPVPEEARALRRAWGLDERFVVGYSGNLGRVHEFDTILEAARMLLGEDDIRFVFVGEGPRLAEVRRRVRSEALANVEFRPSQPRERLAASLGAADVHLCVLHPGFEGLVQPSKLYGIMAAARPILFIGDPAGESAAILAKFRSGVAVLTHDADALAGAIRHLRADAGLRETMGRSARAAFEHNYDLTIALERWEALLRKAS